MSTETTTTHTPGPCIARQMVSGHYQIVEDETGRHIGTIDKDINPAIFAAAPDLLEALNNATVGLMDFQREAGEGAYPKLDHLIPELRAAIARATGEV